MAFGPLLRFGAARDAAAGLRACSVASNTPIRTRTSSAVTAPSCPVQAAQPSQTAAICRPHARNASDCHLALGWLPAKRIVHLSTP